MSVTDELFNLKMELTSAKVYIDQLQRVLKSEREQITALNDYIRNLHEVMEQMKKESYFYKSTHPKFEEFKP